MVTQKKLAEPEFKPLLSYATPSFAGLINVSAMKRIHDRQHF